MFPRSVRRSYILFFIMFLSFIALFASINHGISTRLLIEKTSSIQSVIFGVLFVLNVLSGIFLCLNHVFGNLLENYRAKKALTALANHYNAALAMPRKIPLVGEMIFWDDGVETRLTLELLDLKIGKIFEEKPPPMPTEFTLKGIAQSMMRPRRQGALPQSLAYHARLKIHYKIETGLSDVFKVNLPCARVFPCFNGPTKDPALLRKQLSNAIDKMNDRNRDLHGWLRRVDDETLTALADVWLDRIDLKPNEVTVVLRHIPLSLAEGEKALNAASRLRDVFMVASEHRRSYS